MDTKIQPMDLDAVIERNGHFLIHETKTPGKRIEEGQIITLTEFWRKNFTIFHVEGKTPETICGLVCYWEGKYDPLIKVGDLESAKADWQDVLFQTRRWFCCASGIAVPTRQEWDRQLWCWDLKRNEQSLEDARRPHHLQELYESFEVPRVSGRSSG